MLHSPRLQQILSEVITVSHEKAAEQVAASGGRITSMTVWRLRKGFYPERCSSSLTQLARAYAREILERFAARDGASTGEDAVRWLVSQFYADGVASLTAAEGLSLLRAIDAKLDRILTLLEARDAA